MVVTPASYTAALAAAPVSSSSKLALSPAGVLSLEIWGEVGEGENEDEYCE
jgi:hypothetical protein